MEEVLVQRIQALETQVAKLEKLERVSGPVAALEKVISTYTMMHGARNLFLWNRDNSALSEAQEVLVDQFLLTGTGLDIQGETAGIATRGLDGYLTYGVFDGVDDYYWTGSSDARLRFNQNFTAIAWVYFDAASLGAISSLVSIWRTATPNRDYLLQKTAADQLEFRISSNGTDEYAVLSSLVVAANQWYFVAARFASSTELAIWVSDPATKQLVKDTNASGIPVSKFYNTTANFGIGARNSAAGVNVDFLAGRMGLLWQGAKATPDNQIENGFRVARPLLGY